MMKYILLPCLLATVSHSLIRCAKVRCIRPECAEDEVLFTPSGQCCPKCYKEGDNCGTPGQDCSAIRAPSFLCQDGKTCWGNCGECTFEQDQKTGELYCSPWKPQKRVCNNVIDCTAVLCSPLYCSSNEESYVPEDACCPRCIPKPVDCTAVLCAAPDCPIEQQYTPLGECCPTCKAVFCTDDTKLCPDGSYVGRDSKNNCEFFPCLEDTTCKKNQCMDGTGQCVDGSIVNCKMAPCAKIVNGCKDGQLCTNNYCNGCNTVCDKCSQDKYCIDGLGNCVFGTIWYCFMNPCDLNNGGCTDEQDCTSNYCNGCNTICVPKCDDWQCRNSDGGCQTKTCIQDPCNNIKDPCPGELCSADTCSYPVCRPQCSPCPTETHYIDKNNRRVPYVW